MAKETAKTSKNSAPKAKKTSPLKFFKSPFGDLIINIGLVITAFVVALGIFVVYKNNETQKEINSLIPNAKSAYEAGNYSTAINLFTSAEKQFPNDLEVKEYLGKLNFQKGKYQDAVNYFENVQKSKALSEEEIDLLGNAYIRLDKKQDVINLWKDKQISAGNQYLLANIYLQNKDYDNYFATLEKIKTYQEPLIYLQVRENSLANIIKNIDLAITQKTISSENIDVELYKTQMTEAKKQADLGKKEYSELIQLVALANINQCDFILQRITSLRTTLEAQKIPTYQVDFLDGKCANQRNDPTAAIPLITKAVNADVTNIEYREELAKSYFLKKDKENLKNTFDDIYVIKKSSDSLKSYAGYLYKLGEKQLALDTYNQAFKIASTNSQKEELGKYIVQISFLDFKNLEVCKDNDIVSALDIMQIDDYFLKSNCDVFNQKNILEAPESGIKADYIKSLARKDRSAIEKVLDSDDDGFVTTYYNAVGYQLIQ